MNYDKALSTIFEKPRPGQLQVIPLLDTAHHLAFEAPPGSGKSGVAVALAAHYGGAQIVTHSNVLASQYLTDLAVWAPKLGLSYTRLAGSAHYWCPLNDPDLSRIPSKAKQVVLDNDGCFIGTGLAQFDYIKSSLQGSKAYDTEDDDTEEEVVPKKQCSECEHRYAGCPLWMAREAAMQSDIVVTNAALSAVALKVAHDNELDPDPDPEAPRPWVLDLVRPVLVVDEADSCESLYRSILVPARTISKYVKMVRATHVGATLKERVFDDAACRYAGDGPVAAVEQVRIAADRGFQKLADWLEILGDREPEMSTQYDREGLPKVELRVPSKMDKYFARHRVVAMSATLVLPQARWLGVDVDRVHPLSGLDLSDCRVNVRSTFPSWKYAETDPAAHDRWAKAVADLVICRFVAGPTAALFTSKVDLQAVQGHLDRNKIKTAVFVAGVDREQVIADHRKDAKDKVLMGCFAGAGRGTDLPGDLLEHVVIARVAQNPPRGLGSKLSLMRWRVGSAADIVQSVGRICRFDGDRGTVDICGGFGSRRDIREALVSRGWPLVADES